MDVHFGGLPSYFIAVGRNNAIWGNTIRSTIQITNANTKGNTPLNMVYIGTSRAIPAMTNTFMPMGGVINPISSMITVKTPNHIG